jgi:tyrosine decarboxylase/aspartate 1-decarboxylase
MSDGDAWRWPLEGSSDPGLVSDIESIGSPYEQAVPPFCYPGTPMSMDLLGVIPELMRKQLNGIGFHTTGDVQEGGFDSIQGMERRAIWMIASMLGGVPQSVDGYFCGGGTEANLQALYIGRQYLRRFDDPHKKGIAVLCTPLTHYSIFFKGTNLLGLTNQFGWETCPICGRNHKLPRNEHTERLRLVGVNAQGEMDLRSLEHEYRKAHEEGYRQFLVVATAGTCLMGSIDPIEKIGQWISRERRMARSEFYFHVDASFGGFTIPFAGGNPPRIGFDVPEVHSVTVDADKMGHLPYPAGVFLCRKGMQQYIDLEVAYIRGHGDCTISGSRSAIAPVLASVYYRRLGVHGQQQYVRQCLEARDLLKVMLQVRFGADSSVVRPLACSPFVNFLPLVINLEKGSVPESLTEHGDLQPYHLRSDGMPQDPMDPQSCPVIAYKLCLMPHTFPHLERFVDDLAKVARTAGKFGI